jgi:hypothetical protein
MGLLRFGLSTVVSLAFAGCGSESSVVPVSGKVTLDGKALPKAHVSFQPRATAGNQDAGTGSYSVTDDEGSYVLRLTDSDKPGAVVGTHRVEINLMSGGGDRDPKTMPRVKTLPLKYNRQSELQFEVKPGGTSAANFDLKSTN